MKARGREVAWETIIATGALKSTHDRRRQDSQIRPCRAVHRGPDGPGRDEVLFTHQDAYEHIVDVVKGLGKLRSLNGIQCDQQAPNPVGT
jgi:hypothetical protein